MKIVHLAPVLLVSFILAACGGGGGGSSSSMPTTPTDPTPTDPTPTDPTPPGPTPAEARAEAMRIAGIIGPTPKLADADASSATTDESIVTLAPTAPEVATSGRTVDTTSRIVQAVEVMFQTTDDGGTATDLTSDFKMSADMPAMISGWNGGVYTFTSEDGMTTHKVTKYNDKAPNGAMAYRDYFDVLTGNLTHGAGTAVTSFDNATGVLTLDGADVGGNHGLFAGDFGITAGSQVLTRTDNAATSEMDESMYSVVGSFRGVPGTFSCGATGASCTVQSDAMGNLSQLSSTGSTWTFTPTAVVGLTGQALADAIEDIVVQNVIQDADFMIFGFWEQSVTDDDGNTEETMLPFADGKRDYGTVASVTGTATYTGPATGLYMQKSLTPQGQPTDPFTSGQFTADARLVANFGGGSVAANDQFSVTGTISNFMDGGEAINPAWVVNLARMNLGTAAAPDLQQNMYGSDPSVDGDGSTGMFGGPTNGGALGSGAGTWSGTFHGAGDQPGSASGTFDAHFTNGHVRGAFAVD